MTCHSCPVQWVDSPLPQGMQTRALRSGTAESAAQRHSLCLQVHLAAWMHLPFIGFLKKGPRNVHTLAVLWKVLSIEEAFLSAGEVTCVQPEQFPAQLQVS